LYIIAFFVHSVQFVDIFYQAFVNCAELVKW